MQYNDGFLTRLEEIWGFWRYISARIGYPFSYALTLDRNSWREIISSYTIWWTWHSVESSLVAFTSLPCWSCYFTIFTWDSNFKRWPVVCLLFGHNPLVIVRWKPSCSILAISWSRIFWQASLWNAWSPLLRNHEEIVTVQKNFCNLGATLVISFVSVLKVTSCD